MRRVIIGMNIDHVLPKSAETWLLRDVSAETSRSGNQLYGGDTSYMSLPATTTAKSYSLQLVASHFLTTGTRTVSATLKISVRAKDCLHLLFS